jgi:hypothetical protein
VAQRSASAGRRLTCICAVPGCLSAYSLRSRHCADAYPQTLGHFAARLRFCVRLSSVPSAHTTTAKLLAVSDLHVAFPENRKVVENLRPASATDWLLVAGDVGELFADIEWALRTLSERFATVVWTPGNHELWTHPRDAVRLRGEERYTHLVKLCRNLGVITPEDPYRVWDGADGPVTIAPLYLLYDYTFRRVHSRGLRPRAPGKVYKGGRSSVDCCPLPLPLPLPRHSPLPSRLCDLGICHDRDLTCL